ncbi:MAG: bifunctional tetrahydrofolate synthase/dihydrofolate synthase [Pseudomonadota bacterium]
MTHRRTLNDWLAWIEHRHPLAIELRLDRVQAVLASLGDPRPAPTVITVAGTNGKGSVCAMLESCLRAAGYRVGLYTSPHLRRYNERVRIDGREAGDEILCAGFERVETARGDRALTYFEFGTLAAFVCFAEAGLDVAILEVGLGGRLDAVNAIDSDCAVVTAIDLDHQEWLGDTREAIGREKAGIFRAGRPAICGDPDPPASLLDEAARVGVYLFRAGRDFRADPGPDGWAWRASAGYDGATGRQRSGLPYPSLRGAHQIDNAATALMALECLAERFPVNQAQVREGLLNVRLPGRFQVLPGRPLRVLDVAHNPQAVRVLATTLREQTVAGRTVAVFGMLKDKDIAAVFRDMRSTIDGWYLATLGGERGATAEELARQARAAGIEAPLQTFASPVSAWAAAMAEAGDQDRVVGFGSFYVVGDILASLDRGK